MVGYHRVHDAEHGSSTLAPAAASPISPKRTAPETVCTSLDIRNPEYAVNSVSTPIATVPGSHPILHAPCKLTDQHCTYVLTDC